MLTCEQKHYVMDSGMKQKRNKVIPYF